MKQRKNHPTAINARESNVESTPISVVTQKKNTVKRANKKKSQAFNTAFNTSIIIAGLTFALNPISQQVVPYSELTQSVIRSFSSSVFVEAQGYLPIAFPDIRSTDPLTPITIQVDENDVANPPSALDPTSIEIVQQPTQGTVIVNLDGSVLYTPDISIDRNTVDTFRYTIENVNGFESNSTTVTINIIVPAAPLPEPEPTPQPQPEVIVVPQPPVINQPARTPLVSPTLPTPIFPSIRALPAKPNQLPLQDTIRSGGETSHVGYVFSLSIIGLFMLLSILISLRKTV